MNKNKFFVHRGLVLFSLAQSLILALLLLAVALIAQLEWWVSSLQFILVFSFALGMHLIPWKNAFGRVVIDEEGIRNKHLHLSWEQIDEIDNYSIHHITVLEYKIIIPPVRLSSVVSIGAEAKSSFCKESSRYAILFSLDKGTLSALEKYGAQKSRVIRDILSRYQPE